MKARLKALDRFKAYKSCKTCVLKENDSSKNITSARVLIATDVASRGIDIPGVGLVIHYHLPHNAELYVHRSGRAGRSRPGIETVGQSVVIVTPQSFREYSLLCKNLGRDTLHCGLTVDASILKVRNYKDDSVVVELILRSEICSN